MLLNRNAMERPPQYNCQVEPPYPAHHTVVFSIRNPDMVGHMGCKECPVEYPHLVNDCPLFNPRNAMNTAARNNAILDSIRVALKEGKIEEVKSLVPQLDAKTMPGELFDAVARAYTVAGGREYAKEDASHGDSGHLYKAAEVPDHYQEVMSGRIFTDAGPINVRE